MPHRILHTLGANIKFWTLVVLGWLGNMATAISDYVTSILHLLPQMTAFIDFLISFLSVITLSLGIIKFVKDWNKPNKGKPTT